MSDAEMRELERRAAQGDLEAAARGLLVRLRRAGLLPERVRLAACLGDPAARLALGPAAPPDGFEAPGDDLGGRTALAVELEKNGKEAGVRAALAVAEWALPRWHRPREGEPAVAAAAVAATRRWIDCPCEVHGRDAERAAAAALRVAMTVEHAALPRGITDETAWEGLTRVMLLGGIGPRLAANAAHAAALDERPARVIVVELSLVREDGQVDRLEVRKTPAYRAASAATEGLSLAARLDADLASPLEALRAALVPWALPAA